MELGFRIGHGYDVHRLTMGRELIIGGIKIPFDMGLAGHSDADVLTHAVIDALLGALALGDIGALFPDTDSAYKNADSLGLLRKVYVIVRENGYVLVNLDSTVLAERPKLAPYISKMRTKLAEALSANNAQISIKATTEEGLGFTGEGLGIAAHAVVMLARL